MQRGFPFFGGDPCDEIASINTASAVLAKPCTRTSTAEKRQNGNRQRCSISGERNTKQSAAAIRGFQHFQYWKLNTKANNSSDTHFLTLNWESFKTGSGRH